MGYQLFVRREGTEGLIELTTEDNMSDIADEMHYRVSKGYVRSGDVFYVYQSDPMPKHVYTVGPHGGLTQSLA